MNILLVTGGATAESGGGIGSVVDTIYSELNGIDCDIICKSEENTTDPNIISTDCYLPGFSGDLQYGKAFRNYIREYEYDVIHFHLPTARGPLLFLPEETEAQVIVTFHTTPKGHLHKVHKKIEKKSIKDKANEKFSLIPAHLIDKKAVSGDYYITSVSSGVKEEVEQYYGTEVNQIVQNGSPIQPITSQSSETKETKSTLMFVGEIVPQKGIFDCVDIMSAVDDLYNCHVVGSGAYLEKMKAYQSKISADICFHGFVDSDDLYDLYINSDIILMPSYYEGLPMVGLEAAATGNVIAGYSTSRTKDIVCEQNKNILVDPGRTSKVIEMLVDLDNNPELTDDIGIRNRRIIDKNFRPAHMVNSYKEIYESLNNE